MPDMFSCRSIFGLRGLSLDTITLTGPSRMSLFSLNISRTGRSAEGSLFAASNHVVDLSAHRSIERASTASPHQFIH